MERSQAGDGAAASPPDIARLTSRATTIFFHGARGASGSRRFFFVGAAMQVAPYSSVLMHLRKRDFAEEIFSLWHQNNCLAHRARPATVRVVSSHSGG
jgi:hypothetical protein